MPLNCKETLELGIQACDRGDWEGGLAHLRRLKHQEGACGGLPAIFYSYLGLAMARCESRMHEGLEWCSHALASDGSEPAIHLNLARTYLLLNNRPGALYTLREALTLFPDHPGLLELRRKVGVRRRLPVWFLARGSQLNQFFGRLRARSEARRKAVLARRRVGDETTGILRPAD